LPTTSSASLNLTRPQTQHALWELATAGLAAADGFDQLRAMMDPRRKHVASAIEKKTRSSAGRWSLLCEETQAASTRIEQARRTDAALESAAKMLLARYGVVFRDLLVRESNAPKWRDLLGVLRRLEARGEVRGGRFLSGFGGEQFAGIVIPGERVASLPGKSVRFRNGQVVAEEPVPAVIARLPKTARLPRYQQQIAPVHTPEPSALTLF
jgi:ATP-dependent Lhr-like helicase